MDFIVNTRLLANYMNWFSIGAMLLLVFVAYTAIRSHCMANSTVAVDSPDNPAAAFAPEK
jgi:hypothetical protein